MPSLPACEWSKPVFWLLLLLLPLGFYLSRWFSGQSQGSKFSAFFLLTRAMAQDRPWAYYGFGCLRCLVLGLLVSILAGPQWVSGTNERRVEAADIMLVLDVSKSMLATDLHPDRLAAAKHILEQFIRARSADRLGLEVFSGEALTLSPLTFDTDTLLAELAQIGAETIRVDGTAMGDAVVYACNRLLEPQAGNAGLVPAPEKNRGGKVIILATDGANNRGLDPLLAARVAAGKGLRIYTVGLGSTQPVPRIEINEDGVRAPVRDIYGQQQFWELPDEPVLRAMAQTGNGRYFRAENTQAFAAAMQEISNLEKNRVKTKRRFQHQEAYAPFLAIALALLAAEAGLKLFRFRELV